MSGGEQDTHSSLLSESVGNSTADDKLHTLNPAQDTPIMSIIDFRSQALDIADDLDAHQHMLLCCLKYMSQDDVEDMLKINDYITPPELDEEEDSWYTDPMSKASYHHY